MSIVQNPIIGRAKGQAGGMVFTTLNGQNVMKAKPNSYRDANTLVQQGNRSLHTDIVRMAASIKSQARSLFEKQPSDMPAFSKLVQQLSAGVDRSGGAPVFDPDGLTIGSGSIDLNVINDSAAAAAGSLKLTWTNPADFPVADSAIMVSVLVIDTVAKKLAIINTGEDTIAQETITFLVPEGFTKANCKLALVNNAKLSSGADLQKVVK